MKQKTFALILLTLTIWGWGCSPFYTGVNNKDYWGVANTDEQLKAIAVRQIADDAKIGSTPAGTTVSIIEDRPAQGGFVFNASGSPKIIKITGAAFDGSYVVKKNGVCPVVLKKGNVYIYSVFSDGGSVYKGAYNKPLPMKSGEHSVDFGEETYKCDWFIYIR